MDNPYALLTLTLNKATGEVTSNGQNITSLEAARLAQTFALQVMEKIQEVPKLDYDSEV